MYDLREYGIGMPRTHVVLQEHDERWIPAADAVVRFLSNASNGTLKCLHIGSTAIPGIVAKPILDFIGIVTTLDEAEQLRPTLETLGGLWRGEYGIPGRRFVVFPSADAEMSLVHLHIFDQDCREIARHVAFRDHLLANRQDALLYDTVKRQIAEFHSADRDAYTGLKDPFISSVLGKIRDLHG